MMIRGLFRAFDFVDYDDAVITDGDAEKCAQALPHAFALDEDARPRCTGHGIMIKFLAERCHRAF